MVQATECNGRAAKSVGTRGLGLTPSLGSSRERCATADATLPFAATLLEVIAIPPEVRQILDRV